MDQPARQVHIPENCKGWVTGNRGSELRRMEMETGTYMFMALDKRGEDRSDLWVGFCLGKSMLEILVLTTNDINK